MFLGPVSTKLDSSVKISKYNNYKKPPHNYNFEKKDIQPGETPWQTAMKKMWLPRQNGHGCKKTKKAVSKHENLWQFLKIGNTFFEITFFFANEKKLIFERKKSKFMQQFQLKIYKNTLLRSIFDISNETLHIFKISFTETLWN